MGIDQTYTIRNGQMYRGTEGTYVLDREEVEDLCDSQLGSFWISNDSSRTDNSAGTDLIRLASGHYAVVGYGETYAPYSAFKASGDVEAVEQWLWGIDPPSGVELAKEFLGLGVCSSEKDFLAGVEISFEITLEAESEQRLIRRVAALGEP